MNIYMLAPTEVLLSFCVLAVAAFATPTHAACPSGPGWMNDGIRPDGSFMCMHNAVIESDASADLTLQGRIYCGAHERPIVIDERHVACAPKGD